MKEEVRPNPRAAGLAYALKLVHEDPTNGTAFSFLVEVWHGEDPAAKAELLAKHIGAEPVKAAWLRCVLRRGVRFSPPAEEGEGGNGDDKDNGGEFNNGGDKGLFSFEDGEVYSRATAVGSGRRRERRLVWSMPLSFTD